MLTVEEIKAFIDNDKVSPKKTSAKEGQRYYEGEHDIKNHVILFVNAEGEWQVDDTKSNIKISHPFFTELVDQAAQYLLSGEGFIKSDNPDLQKLLNERFNDNDDFMAELYECVTGCQVKGFEYMYARKNKDDKTIFECADSIGVVEVKAKDTTDNTEYVIYWYVDHIEKDTKQINRIQVWDKAQTYFYVQEENGEIVLDKEEKHNPRPHTLFTMPNDERTFTESFGFIPFFRLDNGKKQFSDLRPIKPLIDDYDLMNCGLSNNIQDTNEALYIVQGFSGSLDEIMHNMKAKKHIGVPVEGKVDIKTVDIPVEARRAKMELDEQNIYKFGFGLNTHGLKDTAATTNVAIKSAYTLLDLKVNKLKIRLKRFLRKLIQVVLDEVNEAEQKGYRIEDVYFKFEPKIPTNALENAQIELTEAQRRQAEINAILDVASTMPEETVLQLICEQFDIDYNEIKDKLPTDETDAAAAMLEGIVPEEEVIVGDPVE